MILAAIQPARCLTTFAFGLPFIRLYGANQVCRDLLAGIETVWYFGIQHNDAAAR